ncbi:18277_t:CDS:1, partial [Racocetra persica]
SQCTKAQYELEDMIQQEDGEEIETETVIEEESELFTEQLGRLNLSNNQEIEDNEENIELLFLSRTKCHTHTSFQLNLLNEDSTDENLTDNSSNEEFEELNKELNKKLVKQFNNESGEKSVEEVAELDKRSTKTSTEESADE